MKTWRRTDLEQDHSNVRGLYSLTAEQNQCSYYKYLYNLYYPDTFCTNRVSNSINPTQGLLDICRCKEDKLEKNPAKELTDCPETATTNVHLAHEQPLHNIATLIHHQVVFRLICFWDVLALSTFTRICSYMHQHQRLYLYLHLYFTTSS